MRRGNPEQSSQSMGEGKRKRTKTDSLIAEHPFCCFCGGAVLTKTLDHVPARIIFPNKHRPKGLEFPACGRCNSQSKEAEALLAVICRSSGSGREHAVRDNDRLRDAMRATESGFPGLLQKISRGIEYLPVNGILRPFGVLDINLQEVKSALCLVSAKMAPLAQDAAVSRRTPPAPKSLRDFKRIKGVLRDAFCLPRLYLGDG